MNSDYTPSRSDISSDADAKANSLNKKAVFDALSAAGISRVDVEFDGECDQGQIENTSAYAGDRTATVEFPAMAVTLYRAQLECCELTSHEISLREAVEELCYGYLEQEHGGWENSGGAFGEFTFNVTEREITLEFNARFTEYDQHSHTF